MKFKMMAILVTLLITVSDFAAAQLNLQLSGQVHSHIPLDGATVCLYHEVDSLPVLKAVTDSKGVFRLAHLTAGTYQIAVMMIGYSVYQGNNFQLVADTVLPVIRMQPTGLDLQEVRISNRKAMVKKKIDRTVINVEAMISNAGSTVYEVLEKSPGIMMDQSGGISLKGKGAVIFIDDQPAYLSGAELESYLKSLPSSAVDQIELMSNPPARYDAAGNGGIINIRTKKSKLKGFNGGVNLSYVQGRHARTNNSFNFNYRYNKVNIFGNAGLTTTNTYSDLDINRHFENAAGALVSNFLQHSYSRITGQNYTGKIGMDYYWSEKTTLGIGLTGIYRPSQQKMLVKSIFTNARQQTDSTVLADNSEQHRFKNIGVNLNYRHLYDKNGRELTADLAYVDYKTSDQQIFDNNSYLKDGLLANNYLLTGFLPAGIKIYSAKIDYAHPLKNGIKLETGLKTSYTHTDNIADYFYTVNQVTAPDYNKTNHFLYQEHINAAYLNANKSFNRLTVQAGLRLENTVSSGHQLGNVQKADSTFKRNYTGLFPTVYLQYKLDSTINHLLSIDYGRRINRPYYQDLNPFLSPIDKFTYYTGNPFLKPSYTNNIELSHTYMGKFTTSLSYGKSHDQVNETIEIINNIYYSRPGNIGSATVKSLSFDGNFELAPWFNLHFYGELTNIHTVSTFYTGQLDTKGTFFYLKPILEFKTRKDWTIQLDGYYQSKVTNAQFVTGERKRMNAAVSKKLSPVTTVKLVVNDVFHSFVNSGVINNLAQTRADYRNVNDSRTAVISLSYRFGKSISNLRQHEGNGAESEQKRVKN